MKTRNEYVQLTEEYPELSQTSKMERFAEIVNVWKPEPCQTSKMKRFAKVVKGF